MSPANNPGPPPVGPSAALTGQSDRIPVPMQNYLTVVDTLKANNGAEAKAMRAMFGGDKALMDRFLAVAFSALAGRSDVLAAATPMSLVQALKDAASLGLEPFSGDGSIVVYDGIAKFMPEWRGYLKRIRNSREVTDLDCQLVYENDVFELELGTNPGLKHVPFLPSKGYNPKAVATEPDPDAAEVATRGDYRGAYAWALMPSGKFIIEWLTADDINYVRDTWGNKRSKNGKPLPWETSWGEMARKTVIRRLAKRLPAAAVDQLLRVEQAHDEAQEQVRVLEKRFSDEMSEVRNLALRAVGAAPQLTSGEPTGEPDKEPPADEDSSGGAAVPAEPTPDAGAPGAAAEPKPDPATFDVVAEPVDPNVAAAMELAREQEKLAAFRRGK